MFGPLMAAASPLLSSAASSLSSKLVGKGVDSIVDKVTGVPTPEGASGIDAGNFHKDYLDTAFPGTTPWERLGTSSPVGAIQSADTAAASAQRMQREELKSRQSVADSTNKANLIGHALQGGPDMVDAALGAYYSMPKRHFDSPVAQGRERIPASITKDKFGFAAPFVNAAKSISSGFPSGSVGGSRISRGDVAFPARLYGSYLKDFYGSGIRTVSDLVFNRGSRPRRFA